MKDTLIAVGNFDELMIDVHQIGRCPTVFPDGWRCQGCINHDGPCQDANYGAKNDKT